jgi:hypothetical protein
MADHGTTAGKTMIHGTQQQAAHPHDHLVLQEEVGQTAEADAQYAPCLAEHPEQGALLARPQVQQERAHPGPVPQPPPERPDQAAIETDDRRRQQADIDAHIPRTLDEQHAPDAYTQSTDHADGLSESLSVWFHLRLLLRVCGGPDTLGRAA